MVKFNDLEAKLDLVYCHVFNFLACSGFFKVSPCTTFPKCISNVFQFWLGVIIFAYYISSSIKPTDIHRRSQTSHTAPCNGVVSHGAQIGGLRVFVDHAYKNKCKTNASTFFAALETFFLSSLSDRSRCSCHMQPDEPRLFWLLEKAEDPNLSPMPG